MESLNTCIALSTLTDLEALFDGVKKNEFDASCYNGDACATSSG